MKSFRFFPLILVLVTAALLIFPRPAKSYLSQYAGSAGNMNRARWDFSDFPVQWSMNPAAASNVAGATTPQQVVTAAFATWTSAPNAAIPISRGPDTQVSAPAFDGVNLVCFTCVTDFSSDGTLAVTFTTTANGPGADDKHGGTSRFAAQILDADILFNPAVKFTTDGSGGSDLQTVVTHEIGHFLGLDHSAVVKAIMFPFAPPLERTLSYDDVAAVSSLYPKSSLDVPVGSISGKIAMNDGSPVFGAHVFADSITPALAYPSSIRKTPIGTLTMPDGTYRIDGVPPDRYTVAAEPLDGPVTNGDVSTYSPAFGRASVQTNFTTRWH
ncbi:MAG TPA: matrixin family metalloprotease [Terriglobales bacterium]|nr:matrixin family metalloprotease [Terriglobales bacterium]